MNDTTLSTFKEALIEFYQGIPEAHRNVPWMACEDGSLTTLPSLGIAAVETVALSIPKPFGKILALVHNQIVLDAEATAERKTNSVEEGGTLTNYGSKQVKKQHYAVIALTRNMDHVVQRDDSLAHAIQSAASLVAQNGSAVRVYKQVWPHPSVEEGAQNLSIRVGDIIKFCDELIRDPDSAEKIRQFNKKPEILGSTIKDIEDALEPAHSLGGPLHMRIAQLVRQFNLRPILDTKGVIQHLRDNAGSVLYALAFSDPNSITPAEFTKAIQSLVEQVEVFYGIRRLPSKEESDD